MLDLCCHAGFSQVAGSRADSLIVVRGLLIAVASLVALGLSSCGSWALERGFSSLVHGLSCSVACGIFPGSGIEPVFPALAGGFLTTGQAGKSIMRTFNILS